MWTKGLSQLCSFLHFLFLTYILVWNFIQVLFSENLNVQEQVVSKFWFENNFFLSPIYHIGSIYDEKKIWKFKKRKLTIWSSWRGYWWHLASLFFVTVAIRTKKCKWTATWRSWLRLRVDLVTPTKMNCNSKKQLLKKETKFIHLFNYVIIFSILVIYI